jgi:hypothetical protein
VAVAPHPTLPITAVGMWGFPVHVFSELYCTLDPTGTNDHQLSMCISLPMGLVGPVDVTHTLSVCLSVCDTLLALHSYSNYWSPSGTVATGGSSVSITHMPLAVHRDQWNSAAAPAHSAHIPSTAGPLNG